MSEHTFGSESCGAAGLGESDFATLVEGLRCHTSAWLFRYRADALDEQRRAHARELAATAVLDERGQMDDSIAQADGVSVRTVRERIETARAVAAMPELGDAALAGDVSPEQLAPASRIATPATAAEVAARAAKTQPGDLAAEVRRQKVPTVQEFAERHARRTLRWWWNPEHTFLSVRGDLPDLQGSEVEKVLNQMVERMRPAQGTRRDTWDQRGADALFELCTNYSAVNVQKLPAPVFLVPCVPGEPVTIGGIPLPAEFVEAMLPNAKVELVAEDVHGAPVSLGRPRAVLAKRIRGAVIRRDGKCRFPGCDRRTLLQVHHLLPVSWGGSDSLSNLATVCLHHHQQLAPHGDRLLIGNPNRTDGLRLIRIDELAEFIGDEQVRGWPDTG